MSATSPAQAAAPPQQPSAAAADGVLGPAEDVLVNGWGDDSGYHIDVATGAGGYRWREVALLRPAGIDDASWTGYQCVSGDGRFAAVAVLPAGAVNRAEARDHGALAYSVDLSSGVVKPVASGVAFKYHSPGCGTGQTATFTVNPGSDQRLTQVLTVDLPTGEIKESTTVVGQVTSVVPTPGGPVGAQGASLVRLPASSAETPVEPVRIAQVDGLAHDLRPATGGGVDFVVHKDGRPTSALMHERDGKLSTLGEGPSDALRLMQGRGGKSVALGATKLAEKSDIRSVSTGKLPLGAADVSLDGAALLGLGPDTAVSAPLLVATAGDTLLKRDAADPAAVSVSSAVPALAPAPAGAVSPSTASADKDAPATEGPAARGTGESPAVADPAAAPPATLAAAAPKCAVDRLAENRQVMQPGTAQASWAIQMAEQGMLTGAAYTRPAGYANLGLAAYAPNGDFARVPLKHPASDTFDSVPRSVYQAIVAQESNFSQASWHALPGIAGGALVGDYYGAGGSISKMDYAKADCGYGLGQVTNGMSKGDTVYSVNGQTKIAVDYQENVSAGLQILERTWNQLYDAGITVNGGNPRYLENWYLAAWAYNSGIQPTAAFGNTTGCVPSPTCTSAEGNWGLGWANNPRNPDYPPTRAPYLKNSYADAAHPGNWPYQERIMGWIGQPILRFNQPAYTKPDYHGGKTWLQIPPVTAFCTTDNNCDPTGAANPKFCTLASSQCWWHQAVTFIPDCATTCATSAYTVGAGSTEPAMVMPHPHPPTCTLDSSKVGNAGYGAPIVVDEGQTQPPLNLVGCGAPSNWSQGGTFTYGYGTNAAGDKIGAIDTHQLGVGFGGHILFTHTEDGSNPDLINIGTWTPNLPKLQYYKIKIHLPSTAATATNVVYTVNPGGGAAPWKIRVNQNWGSEEWVTIGTFAMQNGGTLQLTNKSEVTGAGNINYADYDVAYDAVAFVPMGGTPGQPIGGPPGIKDAPKGSNPSWVQCGCVRRTAGDPVDTSTGYFGETFTDLTTPGRGKPLDFTRTYASAVADPAGPAGALASDGPFGWGWTHSYNLSTVTDPATGNITVRQEDGSQVAFLNNAGTYAPSAPRFNATLTKNGTSYTFTRKSKEVFTFDTATGRLLRETDLAGSKASPPYATTLGYDGAGHLSTITDPGGRSYTLTWTGSHITGLADGSGRQVSYGYDAAGNLTDVLGVGTTRTPVVKDDDHFQYGYTANHLLNSMRWPTQYGSTATPASAVSMTYDAAQRVLVQTDQLGGATTFTYGPDSGANLAAGQTLVTDPAGHKTLYTYQNGLLQSETKGYGTTDAGAATYTYDPISLGITSIADPLGNLQTFSYDDHGNQTSASDARGFTTANAYDGNDNLISTVDGGGLRTTYGYDEPGHIAATGSGFGLLTSVTRQPKEGSTAARQANLYYDDSAHPADGTRAVDARGNTSSNTYDSAGNVVSSTDPENNQTKYGYDLGRGKLTSVVLPVGVAAGTTPGCAPPAKGCTAYSYDVWGNLSKVTDPLGHSTSGTFNADGDETSTTDANNRTTTYAYDPLGRRTSVTRPDSTVITTVYNPDGTVAKTVDGRNSETLYGYDGQLRQTTRTDPLGRKTTARYDAAGNLLTLTDQANQVTTYTYNPVGLPTSVSYSDGTTPNVTQIGYDETGHQTSMVDGSGTSTRTYTPFGEPASQTNGAGAVVGYTYDANGNQVTTTYPGAAGHTVSRTFDKANRQTSLQDWNGKTTAFGYNADSLQTSTTYPNGTVATTVRDDAGQPASDTLAKGTSTLAALTYTRDAAGQLSSETPVGVPGGSRTFGYNSLKQLTSATTAGSAATAFAYDAADNPVQVGDTKQVFDAANQLCWSVAGTAPGNPVCGTSAPGATSYSFDTRGNRTGSTSSAGTTAYAYDMANRLTSATVNGTTSTYGYDGNGLRSSKTAGGSTTSFVWDSQDDPNLLFDGSTSYIYGPHGVPVEQITAGGTQWFFHDQLGSTRALTDAAGAVAGTYSYTPYGTTSGHTGTAASALQFQGQYSDAETSLIYLRARYYDPGTAQFLSVDPDVKQTNSTYGYAYNNPLNKIDPSGKWGFLAVLGGVAAGLSLPEVAVAVVVAVAVTVAVYYVASAINDRINQVSSMVDSYNSTNSTAAYVPPPANLPAFPDAKLVPRKTPVKNGGGLRKRWKDKDGCIYEWDSQHGAVEKYDKKGKHLGEYDPDTGEQTKPADKKRKVEK
ncbi:colicin E3/pyocin S6 family cytotoxin [Kitasatospora purpeofusca]|uniref:colicin E3/pyocin S6 family cytotoxin n=1 Tax=Kitasatospora purpeofusca TaxID=67352 RepID=UPI002A59BDDB|nr:colicin E3/pyocin S6 family cytotoxin [Kitasatospora purpeofusca]MDY0810706.1 colicin E3/pyocin S6 family cytotoxin [Kitasatospora purpeofusca]